MTTVAAVIPTLPTRQTMLTEAVNSVLTQTRPADEIHVVRDVDREGAAATRNRGAAAATTDWLAFLDDDDLWYPHHLETLLAHSGSADIVYPYCDVEGTHDFNHNCPFDPVALEHANYIPVTVLIRRRLFTQVGGFPEGEHCEDWALWKTLAQQGARFVSVPVVTWRYRFHGAQRTFHRV